MLRRFLHRWVVALICSRGPQEGALSAVCPSQIRVTSIRCSAGFPEPHLWTVSGLLTARPESSERPACDIVVREKRLNPPQEIKSKQQK